MIIAAALFAAMSAPATAQTPPVISGWNEYSTPCGLGSDNPNTTSCDLYLTGDILATLNLTPILQGANSGTATTMPAAVNGYSELKVGKHTSISAYAVLNTDDWRVTDGWNIYIKPQLLMDQGFDRLMLVSDGTTVTVYMGAKHHKYATETQQGYTYRLEAGNIPSDYGYTAWLTGLSRPSLDEYCGGGWSDWDDPNPFGPPDGYTGVTYTAYCVME